MLEQVFVVVRNQGIESPLIDWFQQHQEILGWLGILSIVFFVGTLVAVPAIVVALPQRYLIQTENNPHLLKSSVLRIPYLLLKNAAGILFILAGLAMLVLPGQGILTLVIGLLLMDFPGKRRVIYRVLTQKNVLGAVNRLRTRAGKAPLDLPDQDGSR